MSSHLLVYDSESRDEFLKFAAFIHHVSRVLCAQEFELNLDCSQCVRVLCYGQRRGPHGVEIRRRNAKAMPIAVVGAE